METYGKSSNVFLLSKDIVTRCSQELNDLFYLETIT